MNTKKLLFITTMLFSAVANAYEGEVAITIDDLPFVGSAGHNIKKLDREKDRFNAIKQALIDHKAPATGFVIGSTIERGQWEMLEAFRDAGFQLGNHTYTHESLNAISAQKYIDEIAKTDKILTPLMTSTKYFRYPYLAEGRGEKREKVHAFLKENQYVIAPVTIDTKDFRFNSQIFAVPYHARPQYIEKLKKRYLSYVWKQTLRAQAEAKASNLPNKQIVLIHANLLNSQCMNDLLDLYEKNGYRFITLEEALNQNKSH